MFLYLPDQPGYHTQLEAARVLLANMIRVLAGLSPSWYDDLWITEATPVPCGMSREKGEPVGSGRVRRLQL